MDWPAVNDAPLNGAVMSVLRQLAGLALQPLAPLPQLVQAAASRRAGVLRVLGEGDSAPTAPVAEPVGQQLPVRVLRQRVCVPERHVRFVRRRLGRDAVQDLAHLSALVF